MTLKEEKKNVANILLKPKDSHRQIGIHGIEQPLYNMAAEHDSYLVGNSQSHSKLMNGNICIGKRHRTFWEASSACHSHMNVRFFNVLLYMLYVQVAPFNFQYNVTAMIVVVCVGLMVAFLILGYR